MPLLETVRPLECKSRSLLGVLRIGSSDEERTEKNKGSGEQKRQFKQVLYSNVSVVADSCFEKNLISDQEV